MKALNDTEQHPWLAGCQEVPQEEHRSWDQLAHLPGDSKLLVAQVGGSSQTSPSAAESSTGACCQNCPGSQDRQISRLPCNACYVFIWNG